MQIYGQKISNANILTIIFLVFTKTNFYMTDYKNNSIERLIKLRAHFGLSSKAFAAKAGIDPSNYSSIETGKRSFGDRVMRDICNAFDVNAEWLRNGDGDMLKNSQKIGDITGSNNTAVAGNGNHVNSETDKFLDLLKTQTEMLQKRDAQIDELIALLKK